jgi:hypothetical protein
VKRWGNVEMGKRETGKYFKLEISLIHTVWPEKANVENLYFQNNPIIITIAGYWSC